jgi:hypothetical protein
MADKTKPAQISERQASEEKLECMIKPEDGFYILRNPTEVGPRDLMVDFNGRTIESIRIIGEPVRGESKRRLYYRTIPAEQYALMLTELNKNPVWQKAMRYHLRCTIQDLAYGDLRKLQEGH